MAVITPTMGIVLLSLLSQHWRRKGHMHVAGSSSADHDKPSSPSLSTERLPLAPWTYRSQFALALMLAPLFVPTPALALVWRAFLAPLHLLTDADTALVALACVSIWRVFAPILGLLWLMGKRQTWFAMGLAALMAGYIALVDATTVLLLTGGEPFNATHNWASWAFQTIWVTRNWGQGAAMVCTLAATALMIDRGSIGHRTAHPATATLSTQCAKPGRGCSVHANSSGLGDGRDRVNPLCSSRMAITRVGLATGASRFDAKRLLGLAG